MATKAGIDAWWELAACKSVDPELFFPVVAAGVSAVRISRAKTICEHCVIRRQCLDYALVSGEPYGIWGGTTEDERRAIAARRKLPQQIGYSLGRP